MKNKTDKIMNFIKKNFTKIIIALSITIVATSSYFYLSKSFKLQKAEQEYKLSRPDNRPDEIKGEIVTLKRLQPKDFKTYYQMVSDPKVIKPLYLPRSYAKIKKYLYKILDKERNGLIFIYTIFDNKDDILVGGLAIREPNPKDPGQFYCWLNSKYWGGGRISEAIKLLTREYFKIKKAKKFSAHVEMWNLRSYFALKKNGFKLIKTIQPEHQKPRYYLEFYNPNFNSEKK